MALVRGKVPCDVLFVGDSPGESEDVLGVPFMGPAGKLLDHMVYNSVPDGVRCGFANVLGCVPRTDQGGFTTPSDDCIDACSPRLMELVMMCSPQVIVLLGADAHGQRDVIEAELLSYGRTPAFVNLVHPAYILRSNISQQGLLRQRAEIAITVAIEENVK